MTSGNGLTVAYASYNKPASITRGTNTLFFSHDPEHQRFKQVAPGGTTLYLGSGGAMVEKFTGSGGEVRWTHYLVSAGGLVGMHIENSDETVATRYFHKDHLGSIAVITSEAGAVLERLSYDAWGKRRYPNGSDDPAGSITSQTSRGFTGHEELADVGLVHMNGRVYDPLLARFGTPDPMTESPFSTQGWNRYSYVGNSPLNFTDPSGYCFLGCFWKPIFKAIGNFLKQSWGSILQIAAGAICTPFGLGPVCAAAAATFVTGVTSGNLGMALRAGLISAVTAAAFQFVGTATAGNFPANIAGHAAVGCMSAVASGGDCKSGALAAGVSAAGTPLIDDAFPNAATDMGQMLGGTVASSVLGGIGSVAGGGKFANGAVTGAYGYLFNHLGHMLAGREAHQLLLEYLQERDGDVWSGDNTYGGLFGSKRPDLIFNREGVVDIFEIKPAGSDALGAKQLQGYLDIAGSAASPGPFGLIFTPLDPIITRTGAWFGASYTFKPGAYSGVVVYSVDQSSLADQILKVLNQKPSGIVWPGSKRRPPAPGPR
jgi:RHS repeat-associated protein